MESPSRKPNDQKARVLSSYAPLRVARDGVGRGLNGLGINFIPARYTRGTVTRGFPAPDYRNSQPEVRNRQARHSSLQNPICQEIVRKRLLSRKTGAEIRKWPAPPPLALALAAQVRRFVVN